MRSRGPRHRRQQIATLNVNGILAILSPTPANLNFGSGPAAQPRDASVSVINTGDGVSGNIAGRLISAAPPGTFTITGSSCGAPLSPGSQCSVAIRFTPPSAGFFSATLVVEANPGTPSGGTGVMLAGTGS